MKNANVIEQKIMEKYKQNMRKNEDAILVIRNKEEELDRQEDNLYKTKTHLSRYCEEQRERYAGTDEMIRYNRMENDIYELTSISRNLLDKEYEELKKEEKRLYEQQETYYEEYLSEIRAHLNKEDN